jgi:CRISPR-associated protein Cas1
MRSAHGAGLDPMVGFYHQPAHGRESLACDLMEPLRPRADQWVRTLFRDRVLRLEHFAIDKGACLLGKASPAPAVAYWRRPSVAFCPGSNSFPTQKSGVLATGTP